MTEKRLCYTLFGHPKSRRILIMHVRLKTMAILRIRRILPIGGVSSGRFFFTNLVYNFLVSLSRFIDRPVWWGDVLLQPEHRKMTDISWNFPWSLDPRPARRSHNNGHKFTRSYNNGHKSTRIHKRWGFPTLGKKPIYCKFFCRFGK